MKPTIVVSAVNLVEGGTLTILQQCLSCLDTYYTDKYNVVALVHRKELFNYEHVKYIEFPWVKERWIRRIYFEYIYCWKLSKQLKPYLWLALHDITPNVSANLRVVYCHNPSPFLKTSLKLLKYNYKEFLFSLFYRWIYRINIKQNDIVIVQQEWLKRAFAEMFDIPLERIIISRPISIASSQSYSNGPIRNKNKEVLFFYPSFPRSFKNFEVVCEACRLLEIADIKGFKIVITIKGDENAYAKEIYKKYGNLKNLVFTGVLHKDEVKEIYAKTDCLVFPSKLETWGLPISEFAVYGKPMIIADLPYAHETAAGADKVRFFNPNSASSLQEAMLQILNKDLSNFIKVPIVNHDKLCFASWADMVNFILQLKKDRL